MKRFYYSNNSSDVSGPIGMSDLTALHSAGAISGSTLICEEGSEEWYSAESILSQAGSPNLATMASGDATHGATGANLESGKSEPSEICPICGGTDSTEGADCTGCGSMAQNDRSITSRLKTALSGLLLIALGGYFLYQDFILPLKTGIQYGRRRRETYRLDDPIWFWTETIFQGGFLTLFFIGIGLLVVISGLKGEANLVGVGARLGRRNSSR